MTCKNCLYFNTCYVLADNPEEAEVEGAETDCSSFADRSRYVVREKGEWVYDHWCEFKCSKCGNPLKIPTVDGEPIYNYCLHCGAKMGNAWGERND